VLFVGESPPVGGTFFYAANSKLYFAIKRALDQAVPDLVDDDFLVPFRSLGCHCRRESAGRVDLSDDVRLA
jgi:hypothetical protein